MNIQRSHPKRAPRPRSATQFLPSCAVFAVASLAILLAALAGVSSVVTAFVGLGVGVFGLLWTEYRWPSADRSGARVFRPLPPRNWSRTGVKLVGLAVTLSVLTLGYAALGPFIEKDVGAFLSLWPIALAVMAIFAPFVFVETDRRMAQPEDAYYAIGRAISGKPGALRWDTLRAHTLAWIVKGFFMPLMMSWYIKLIVVLTTTLGEASDTPLATALLSAMLMMFIVDLLGAFIGYSMTFKALGSHIRSVNPMLTGWIAALICYPPFYYLIRTLTQHVEDLAWIDNVVAQPGFMPLAIVILALQLIYTLATVNFGLRFSNLTHRGIVTGGVYRWVKHPAYLSKNLFWWLMSVPFLGAGADAQWAMICIASINIIYFVRAKTEEKHLSADPAYRAYTAWIEDQGLFAPLSRLRRKLTHAVAPQAPRRGWRPAG